MHGKLQVEDLVHLSCCGSMVHLPNGLLDDYPLSHREATAAYFGR
jgi:hypothetical protein